MQEIKEVIEKMKIALFGKIRSGKNTVADILTEEYGFEQFAFGDGIAEIIQKYFPEVWAGGKPRKHYQHIGQQLRVLNENVWVNYLLRRVWDEGRTYRAKGLVHNIVITDGRQLNEAKRMKEEGFLIVKVTTPEEIRIERMIDKGDIFSFEDLKHETELQVDNITPDVEILNDGSLEDLYKKVQDLIQDYKGENEWQG